MRGLWAGLIVGVTWGALATAASAVTVGADLPAYQLDLSPVESPWERLRTSQGDRLLFPVRREVDDGVCPPDNEAYPLMSVSLRTTQAYAAGNVADYPVGRFSKDYGDFLRNYGAQVRGGANTPTSAQFCFSAASTRFFYGSDALGSRRWERWKVNVRYIRHPSGGDEVKISAQSIFFNKENSSTMPHISRFERMLTEVDAANSLRIMCERLVSSAMGRCREVSS